MFAGIPKPVAEPKCPKCDQSKWGIKFDSLNDHSVVRDVMAMVMASKDVKDVNQLKSEDWGTIVGMMIQCDVLIVFCENCGFTASVTPILQNFDLSRVSDVQVILTQARNS